MKCNCIEDINSKLAEQNLQLDCLGFIRDSNAFRTAIVLPTEWVDKSLKKRGQRPISMVANYCPFCGSSCKEDEPAAPVTSDRKL